MSRSGLLMERYHQDLDQATMTLEDMAPLRLGVDWTVTGDDGAAEQHWTRLRHGVLVHGAGAGRDEADTRVRIGRAAPLGLVGGRAGPEELEASGDLVVDGARDALPRLLGVLDPPDPGFAIVTP
ncbi:alkyl sulfatase C-terminal domain-containing protein [Actinomycetospora sp. C-140]